MPIRITAKRDGFRRAGITHSGTPTTHADDRFSARQLAQLKAEPMLIVEVISSQAEQAAFIPDTVTLGKLIHSVDLTTLRLARSEINERLVEGSDVPELLTLRDDINQELLARGYTDPAPAQPDVIAEATVAATTAGISQTLDDAGAGAEGATEGAGTDTPNDVATDSNADATPAETPVKPALKPGKGK